MRDEICVRVAVVVVLMVAVGVVVLMVILPIFKFLHSDVL